ncbi:MAG: ferrochelatase [Cyanobacteria bacterium P01_D01_bin.123]
MSKTGILLLNLGGPETQADVKPFLFNLFADPEIIRLPIPWLQKPLAAFIATMRSEKSKRNYAAIGGGSPLRQITEAQADALKANLSDRGLDVPIYIAMRYWHPFTEDVVQQLKSDDIERVVVLPLYPQYSITTSGSSFKLLDELWQADPQLAKIERITISSWYDQPDYINSMAATIATELDRLDNPDDAYVLFSAHGVPESYVQVAGDPYQQEIEGCIRLIWQKLARPNDHSLCYQSRVGPVKWLQPYTEETLVELGKKGVKHLLVVPISFISDHIETLQEIDIEYREVAEKAGVKHFIRVPTLNTDANFINALAKMALPHLEESKVPEENTLTSVS